MKRSVTRILAMLILYNYEITGLIDLVGIMQMIDTQITYDEVFLMEIVNGVINNQKTIDHIISVNLSNYTIDRLSYVDRNLIRIGVYELKYTNIPTNIIIDEIVEISKEYSEIENFNSSKFNNSLLDKIAKGLKDGK